MEQVYQKGRELFFTDGEPLSNYTRFRIDVAEGSLATVEVFQSSGEMETFELVPEPPSTPTLDPRLEGQLMFSFGTRPDPTRDTTITEAQAFMVRNGTLRRRQSEDISYSVNNQHRAQSRLDLDVDAMDRVLHTLGHRLQERAKPSHSSPEYKQELIQEPANKEEVDKAVKRMRRKQVPRFQFVRETARARKFAAQASVKPKWKTLLPADQHSPTCPSRGAAPANLLEPGKAKFTNAPKGTIIHVIAETPSGRKANLTTTTGHTVDLPPLPPGPVDRMVIKANHPDGLQSHEKRCLPANYKGLRKGGFVHQLSWNNPKAHEGAFSNQPTDLGDVVKRVTGHGDRMIVDDPCEEGSLAMVNSDNLEERCPECRGTRIYNCPFKGPVPCSLCGES